MLEYLSETNETTIINRLFAYDDFTDAHLKILNSEKMHFNTLDCLRFEESSFKQREQFDHFFGKLKKQCYEIKILELTKIKFTNNYQPQELCQSLFDLIRQNSIFDF